MSSSSKKTRKLARSFLSTLLLAAFVSVGFSPSALIAEESEAVPVTEQVKAFFDAEEGGTKVVSEEAKKHYASLPAHIREIFDKQVEEERIGTAAQADALLGLKLKPQAFEVVLNDKCVLCHTNPDQQSEETLFVVPAKDQEAVSHLNLKSLVSDVHFKKELSCSGCHGGSPDDEEMTDAIAERWPEADSRHSDRSWIPEFCGNCHASAETMRRFNPGLATDQLSKYKTSKHGRLLLESKDSKAAQCVSCHGVHGIMAPDSPNSRVNPRNIPDTCGSCHANEEYMAGYKDEKGNPLPTNQLSNYKQSVHGKALYEKGDLTAPVCNDCHGNHAAMPPKVSAVSQICRTCHVSEGQLFDGSRHKAKFEEKGWPECETCHGKHDIKKPSKEMIGDTDGTLCHDCHKLESKENPKCDKTAAEFREAFDELDKASAEFKEEAHHLAEKGMDVEPLQMVQSELEDAIKASRANVHSFEATIFDKSAKVGREAVEKGEAFLKSADDEFNFRRTGLAGAIGIIAFLAILVWLKIKQIEKK